MTPASTKASLNAVPVIMLLRRMAPGMTSRTVSHAKPEVRREAPHPPAGHATLAGGLPPIGIDDAPFDALRSLDCAMRHSMTLILTPKPIKT